MRVTLRHGRRFMPKQALYLVHVYSGQHHLDVLPPTNPTRALPLFESGGSSVSEKPDVGPIPRRFLTRAVDSFDAQFHLTLFNELIRSQVSE